MLASNELSRHSPGPLLDSKALCATVRMWVNRTQSDPMFAAIRLPMTVRFVMDMKPVEDQMERSISLSRSTTSFESVMTMPAEFRSNRSPVIVRPVTLETWMATLLLTNALSETVRFSEGRSTKKPAPSFRERSESETVTLRLLATCTPLPLAGSEGRYVWLVSQTETWANTISDESVTRTP